MNASQSPHVGQQGRRHSATVRHALFGAPSSRFKWKSSVESTCSDLCKPMKQAPLNPTAQKLWLNHLRNALEKIVPELNHVLRFQDVGPIILCLYRWGSVLTHEAFFFLTVNYRTDRKKAGRTITGKRWWTIWLRGNLCGSVTKLTQSHITCSTVDLPFLALLIDDPLIGCMTIH